MFNLLSHAVGNGTHEKIICCLKRSGYDQKRLARTLDWLVAEVFKDHNGT